MFKLLLDALLAVLDNDALIRSINFLTSEVVNSAVRLNSLHVLDAAAAALLDNLYLFHDGSASKVATLEEYETVTINIVCIAVKCNLNILEVASSCYVSGVLVTTIPVTHVNLQGTIGGELCGYFNNIIIILCERKTLVQNLYLRLPELTSL